MKLQDSGQYIVVILIAMELWLIKEQTKKNTGKVTFQIKTCSWYLFVLAEISTHCSICPAVIRKKEGWALAKTVTKAKRDKDAFGIVIWDGHLT